jgi:hypothetical protein
MRFACVSADAVREWLIAAGTIGAVVVALYVGVIRERLRRPSLSLHFDGPDEEDAVIVQSLSQMATMAGRTPIDTAYLRLRVRNKEGRNTAEDVEVLVERVRELAPRIGNPPAPPPTLGNWPLPWSLSSPTTTRLSIPPGVERHVDLAHVYRDAAATRGATPLIHDIRPEPTMGRHHLHFGKTEIRLIVSARNADSRGYEVVVAFDGRWQRPGDDIWRHLIVEEVREA